MNGSISDIPFVIELASGSTVADVSGLRSTSTQNRIKFLGCYLTQYQAIEVTEQKIDVSGTNILVVNSLSWPDFVPMDAENKSFFCELTNGTAIYLFKIDYRDQRLNCGSPSKVQICFDGTSFPVCDSVARDNADLSVVIAKVLNPSLKFVGVADRHLRLALKNVDICYNKGL